MYLNVIGKVKNIEYSVTEDDISTLLEDADPNEDLDALTDDLIENTRCAIEQEHGKEMDFYVILEDEDIDDLGIEDPEDIDFSDPAVQERIEQLVSDYITDQTCYCVYSFVVDWDSCYSELPTYQVVAIGYDKKHNYVDDIMLHEGLSKSEAIKVAKSIEKVDDAFLMRRRKNKIAYVNIEVETVLRDGPDSTVNTDTIWTTSIEVA